eukprot:15259_1
MYTTIPLIIVFILNGANTLTVSKPFADVSSDGLQEFGNLVSQNMVDFFNRDLPSFNEYRQADGGWSNTLQAFIDGNEFKNYGQFVKYVNMIRNKVVDGSVSRVGDAETTVVEGNADALDISYCLQLTFAASLKIGSTPRTVCMAVRKYFDDNLIVYRYEMSSDNGFVYNTLFKFVLKVVTTLAPESGSVNFLNIIANPVLLIVIVSVILFTLCIGIGIGWIISNVWKSKKTKNVKGVKYNVVNDTDVSIMSEEEILK